MTASTQPAHQVANAATAAPGAAVPGLGWRRALRDLALDCIAQVRIYDKPYAGIMHLLLFGGVTIQVLGTIIGLFQMVLFVPYVVLEWPRGSAYLAYELVMDLAGVAILVGVAMAVLRRAVLRPKYLHTTWDNVYALGLLTLIPVAGFALEGLRIVSVSPTWSPWSPVGNLVARWYQSMGIGLQTAAAVRPAVFWLHVALGLTLLASMPFTRFRHILYTPLNILLRSRRRDGTLELIENIEEAETLGAGRIAEFAPRSLLSVDACVRCGRCEEKCPASESGLAFSPMDVVQSLRRSMVANLVEHGDPDAEVFDDDLRPETPWHCVSCGACLTACPAFVAPVDRVIDVRRYQVMTTGDVPKNVADTLRNLERQSNPWGLAPEDRPRFARELGLRELAPGDSCQALLFLGCAASYDERNRKVARTIVGQLRDRMDLAVLSGGGTCCGEPARRLGHEYLFQEFARQNIEQLAAVKFDRIITQCPHCFNTIKHEYPQLGGSFPVQHVVEVLEETASVRATGNGHRSHNQRLTYHDSCYLGRYNRIYDPPRRLLESAGVKVHELARRREDSFCCGGGGGGMWMETDAETRINQRRLDDVLAVGADVVATACPYCLIMLDDAVRSRGLADQLHVKDVAEVLAERAAE